MHVFARSNEYADALGTLFDDMPKTVLAAIEAAAPAELAREWMILWSNGIVSQRPSARARAIAAPVVREPHAPR